MNRRQKIILVDDNITNLTMGKNMLRFMYEVYPLLSASKLFEILNNVVPDLILLDIEMPDMNGYETIRLLKADARFRDIPVIFLTAKTDEGSELEGLSLGAIDYVTKPFSAPLLLKRIENQLLIVHQRNELKNYNDNLLGMVNDKTAQVMALQKAMLRTVADMVEVRDKLTGKHVDRTEKYMKVLMNEMINRSVYLDETSSWDVEHIYQSAQLHDVGKIAISDLILNKPGRLTPEEFNEMKRHPTVGVEAIRKIEQNMVQDAFLRHARIIAGTHHEKWDGSGYPAGLRGEEIPLEGRLMAIADVYDALISARPYKEPMSYEDAERIIVSGSGAHFDPALVDVFRNAAPQFAQIANSHR